MLEPRGHFRIPDELKPTTSEPGGQESAFYQPYPQGTRPGPPAWPPPPRESTREQDAGRDTLPPSSSSVAPCGSRELAEMLLNGNWKMKLEITDLKPPVPGILFHRESPEGEEGADT